MTYSAPATNPAPTDTVTAGTQITIRPTTTATYFAGIHMFVYSPSHRFLTANNAEYIAQRTSSHPFYKGVSERFEVQTNDGTMWNWRRISFTTKNRELIPLLIRFTVGAQASSGQVTTRPWRDLSGETSGNYQQAATNLYDAVFAGIATTDWANPMTAKVDRTRINLISDKMRRIQSGNNYGVTRHVKTWLPLNKTLVYDDEENGVSMTPSPYSVTSKQGMGDVYILDLIEAASAVNPTTSVLQLDCSSTTYWHEK